MKRILVVLVHVQRASTAYALPHALHHYGVMHEIHDNDVEAKWFARSDSYAPVDRSVDFLVRLTSIKGFKDSVLR